MSTFYRYCEVCKVQHESREECPNGAVISWSFDKYVSKEDAVKEMQQIEKEGAIKQALYDRVFRFMKDNRVTCVETIHQCDWVIENAYEFMSDLFEIIDPALEIEVDED